MKAWEIGAQTGLHSQHLAERPAPEPREGETLIRVRAVCLNHRDLLSLRGLYGARKAEDRIMASDGVGTIECIVGDDHGLAPGQRVIAPHFCGWVDGPFSPAIFGQDLGISRDGWLAEYICLPTAALVAVPDSVSDDVAATLAAAGTTAWHALVPFGGLQRDDLALTLGTGGVAIMALQIAHALGAEVAITSASDDKLERCRTMGARYTVNYRNTSDWAAELLRQTCGRGADVIVDTVGLAEIEQTLTATAPCGRIALIGGLAGQLSRAPDMFGLISKNVTLKGITSGNREMLCDLLSLVAKAGITSLIDQRFSFDEARQACAHLDRGGHMGKVLITV